jgi:uncharacterized membrane protein YidH (DUF202 family)
LGVAEREVQLERRPWFVAWFWHSLTLLALGLALVAFGEVRVMAAGGEVPTPVMPDYTLFLPNLAVLSGFLIALASAVIAAVTACAALVNMARRRRGTSAPGKTVRSAEHLP